MKSVAVMVGLTLASLARAGVETTKPAEDAPLTTQAVIAAIPKDRKPAGQQPWSKLLAGLSEQWAKESLVGQRFEGTMTVGRWRGSFDNASISGLFEMPVEIGNTEYQTIDTPMVSWKEPAAGEPGRRGERVKVTGTIDEIKFFQAADRRIVLQLRLKDRKFETIKEPVKNWTTNELMTEIPVRRRPWKENNKTHWDVAGIDSWLRAKVTGTLSTTGTLAEPPKMNDDGSVSYEVAGKPFTVQAATWRVDVGFTLTNIDAVKAVKRKKGEPVKVKGRILGVSVTSTNWGVGDSMRIWIDLADAELK